MFATLELSMMLFIYLGWIFLLISLLSFSAETQVQHSSNMLDVYLQNSFLGLETVTPAKRVFPNTVDSSFLPQRISCLAMNGTE